VAAHPRENATDALTAAVDRAVLAPSLHNSQPWQFVVHADRLEIRADRRRHLPGIDPLGRGLAQSVGAALFNARVALAARGRAVEVERRPRADDRDLLAVVRWVDGPPDPDLAGLDSVVARRRTNRRTFNATTPSGADLHRCRGR
jgi:nitroreductase